MNEQILDHAKHIIQMFGDNIIICGGLVDFFWINYQNIADLDFIVEKNAFSECFGMSRLEPHILGNNFYLQKRKSSKYEEILYQGKFYNTKIDFFLSDNLNNEKFTIIDGSKFKLENKPIKIQTIDHRINHLKNHLDYSVTPATEEWEILWIKSKHNKAAEKLPIYKQKHFASYRNIVTQNMCYFRNSSRRY